MSWVGKWSRSSAVQPCLGVSPEGNQKKILILINTNANTNTNASGSNITSPKQACSSSFAFHVNLRYSSAHSARKLSSFQAGAGCSLGSEQEIAQATTWTSSHASLSQEDKLLLHIEQESQQPPENKLHTLFQGPFCTELMDKIKCLGSACWLKPRRRLCSEIPNHQAIVSGFLPPQKLCSSFWARYPVPASGRVCPLPS